METKPTFDFAELELLKEGLKRSYKERFEMATRLYKIQQIMNKASIVQLAGICRSFTKGEAHCR